MWILCFVVSKYQTSWLCFFAVYLFSLFYPFTFPSRIFSRFLIFSSLPVPDTFKAFPCSFRFRFPPVMLYYPVHFLCSWLLPLLYQFLGIWRWREWDFWEVYWVLLVSELEFPLGFWLGFSFLFIPSPRMYRYLLLQASSAGLILSWENFPFRLDLISTAFFYFLLIICQLLFFMGLDYYYYYYFFFVIVMFYSSRKRNLRNSFEEGIWVQLKKRIYPGKIFWVWDFLGMIPDLWGEHRKYMSIYIQTTVGYILVDWMIYSITESYICNVLVCVNHFIHFLWII